MFQALMRQRPQRYQLVGVREPMYKHLIKIHFLHNLESALVMIDLLINISWIASFYASFILPFQDLRVASMTVLQPPLFLWSSLIWNAAQGYPVMVSATELQSSLQILNMKGRVITSSH